MDAVNETWTLLEAWLLPKTRHLTTNYFNLSTLVKMHVCTIYKQGLTVSEGRGCGGLVVHWTFTQDTGVHLQCGTKFFKHKP